MVTEAIHQWAHRRTIIDAECSAPNGVGLLVLDMQVYGGMGVRWGVLSDSDRGKQPRQTDSVGQTVDTAFPTGLWGYGHQATFFVCFFLC